jgi:hypothetical protein
MKEEANKVLLEASKLAAQEVADVPDNRIDAAMHGRVTRHVSIAEKNAAENYYKKSGKYFDIDHDTETHIHIIAMIFAYAMLALLINLILYLPVNYLTRSWGEVNSHDAVYVTIIINTLISAVAVGLMAEITTKRKAFIAGMRAEADNHIVSKYHMAKDKIDEHYASKGHLFDNNLDWRD